jgi:hypothetical protein
MSKLRKLTDKEIKDSSIAISRVTFDFMKKKIVKQMDKFYNKDCRPDYNDIVNITTMALAQIDTNILILTRKSFEAGTNSAMNFALMMHLYIQDIMTIMKEDEMKQFREKMN